MTPTPSNKPWIIVRAEPGASATAAAIAARGGTALVAPLFTIAPIPAAWPDLSGVQALAFTSAHGVRTAPPTIDQALPVFAVGAATAAAARAAGFTDVFNAGADGAALAQLVKLALSKDKGPIVHIRGADVAFDVAGALERAGFATLTVTTYKAQGVTTLAPAILAAARDAQGVLLHSPRGAEAVARLMAPLAPQLAAVCISEATREAARRAPFARFAVAARPTDEALIDAAFAQTDAKG